MCRNPYVTSAGKAYGCGQCLPCRINKRRIWTHRMLLEAAQYKDNAFVTLTYADDSLVRTDTGLPTLDRRDLKLWLMRLNTTLKRLEGPFPKTFRYFACGEYGDESQRPHYHAILFGYPSCAYGITQQRRCCVACELVRKTWGKGIVQIGTVEKDSAQYVAQYVTKKMTAKDDERLVGRAPEFSVMSRRPGIGYDGLYELANLFMRYHDNAPDVYSELRHGRYVKYPLGRYLRSKLREMVGRDAKAPQSTLDEVFAELSDLYAAAKDITSAPGMRVALKSVFADMVVAAGDVRAGRQLARMKMRPRRKVL